MKGEKKEEKRLRRLSYVLLLSVVAISSFALMGFIKPAQAGVGSHTITATYYKAYVHDDHDTDIWPFTNPGEWRFGLQSAVQGYTWTGEISVDGARTVDFSDRSRSWSITGNTWFRCRAEEYDGLFWLDWLDYYSYKTVSVSFPGPSVNTWHYGSSKVGDVTHYYKYYIQNLAPTANPIDDRFISVGVPVSFSGSGSDPEGDSLSYEWDFDDGTTSTEQTPTHTYTDVGTYTVKFRVKDYFGAYSAYKYATVTVTKVIIDQAFVTDNRCDIGSTQTVGFYAKWAHDNASIVGGSIYVNETEHVTDGTGWVSFNTTAYNTVGRRMWNVTGVNCTDITVYEKVVDDPYIIWDRLEAHDYGVSDGRCNVGTPQTVWIKARYDYDDEIFDDSKGYLSIGGIAATWDADNGYWYITVSQNTVTKVDYPSTSSFTDTTYGLTTFTSSVTQSIIWDKVTVTLSAVDDTVEMGSTASITRTAVYQYDGTDFDGTITLNDTLTKSVVGTYYYTTESISGDTHGITAFDSNTVAIEFLDMTAPVVNAGTDQTVTVDTSVSFDASNSTDNVGIVSYEWDFGDETTGTGITTEHTYTETGTYTVTLTVKDAANNSDTDTITITVEAVAAAIPLWIIGTIAALIAAAAVVAAWLLRKRRAPKAPRPA